MTASGERTRLSPWLLLAAGVAIADQVSKLAIVQQLALGQAIELLPVFDLLHARNAGAAFSFLQDAGGWQRWFFTGIAVVASGAIIAMLRSAGTQRLRWALALVLGGAIGNLIDRVRLGYVVDFFHAHWGPNSFPVFNVADCAITLGAGLLILDEWLRWRASRARQP